MIKQVLEYHYLNKYVSQTLENRSKNAKSLLTPEHKWNTHLKEFLWKLRDPLLDDTSNIECLLRYYVIQFTSPTLSVCYVTMLYNLLLQHWVFATLLCYTIYFSSIECLLRYYVIQFTSPTLSVCYVTMLYNLLLKHWQRFNQAIWKN